METSLTVCMLTYNAEATLTDALQSISSHADEIIVLDSGSTDRTVEIAQAFGANVHRRTWDDDFAAARNAALELATSEWILFLDADEQLIWTAETSTLRAFLQQQSKASKFILSCRNIDSETGELLLLSHVERLFRRDEYRYEGRIHEHLIGNSAKFEILDGAYLIHTGYSPAQMVEKSTRNVRLLQLEVERDPHNGTWYRYLANEAYNLGDCADTIEYVQQALELLPWQQRYSRAQAHYYGIMARLSLGQQEMALEALGVAQSELPEYTDLYGIEFELRWHRSEWERAVLAYEQWGQQRQRDLVLPQHLAGFYEGFAEKWAVALREVAAIQGDEMNVTVVLWNVRGEAELQNWVSQWRTFADGSEILVAVEKSQQGLTRVAKSLDVSVCEYGRHPSREQAQLAVLSACRGEWVLSVEASEETRDWKNVWAQLRTNRQGDGLQVEIESRSDRLRHTSWQTRWVKRTNWLQKGAQQRLHQFPEQRVRGAFVSSRLETVPRREWNPFLLVDLSSSTLTRPDVALREGMYLFSLQRYQEAMQVLRTLSGRQAQFYLLLCQINLGLPQEALMLLQDVINDDEEEALLDFCYLYAKMSVAIEDNEVKEEAVELIKDCFRHLHDQDGTFLDLHKSDLLRAVGELLKQIGQFTLAQELYYDALLLSNRQDEAAFYAYLDLLRQSVAPDDLPRLLLKKLDYEDAQGKRLLYLAFCYLGLGDWSELFAMHHESAQYKPATGKVSVILPVFNQTQYLPSSIESVLAQSYENLELLIVDDGSTEDVKRVVEHYKTDKRVRYHRIARNKGLPHALNVGLELASGEYLIWHSADNLMRALLLERLTSALAHDDQCVAAYANYQQIDAIGNLLQPIYGQAFSLNGILTPGPAFLWRATLRDRVGGFDPNLFGIEDRDFVTRVRLCGPFAMVPENLYSYRIHQDSLSAEIDKSRFGGWGALHTRLKQKWFYLSFL